MVLHAREIQKNLTEIESNIKAVINEDSSLGQDLWKKLLRLPEPDIAGIIENLSLPLQKKLFNKLPRALASRVFKDLSEIVQAFILKTLDSDEAADFFHKMTSDELTDLFEHMTDKEVKSYLKLIQRKQRGKIISLLHLNPDSAGRIMNTDVFTLQRDLTVKKSIALLQRLEAPHDALRKIYVTNKEHILVGYINLEDLLRNKPETPLTKLINKNELVIDVLIDQEQAAHQMHHYGLLLAPVVDAQDHFLGVITAGDIVEVVEEEASEDVYRMSGLSPVEHSYFQTSFLSLFWQRSMWLGSLLLLQSVSSFILNQYNSLMSSHIFLSTFYTMLIGTGGNAGNQSATLVIRGLATGEISSKNAIRVLFREFGMSIVIAILLFFITFVRVYAVSSDLVSSLAVSLSLIFIINASMVLGTFIPFFFERLGIDPAHSAAPLLATLMDILGIYIYCFVCSRIIV